VPAHGLDLSAVHPDFVPVSWYKVFGYPTGVGCLIARREALARLRRPWFSGGTIAAASVAGDWHAPASGAAGWEDGTPSFLQVPDVEFGLSWIGGIGLDLIQQHVQQLTERMLSGLVALRHGNGQPMTWLHGPSDTRDRGGTVTFSLLDPYGQVFDVQAVERETAAAGVCIRTGCFCNPGAAEVAFGLTGPDVAKARTARTSAEARQAAGIPGGGAIRASVGLASNVQDVQTFLAVIGAMYRDRPTLARLGTAS
jgi:selenocysteine lyase/cysteine desulfurase